MSNSHILLDRAKAGQLNPNMLGVDASLAVAVYFRLPRYVYFARLDRLEINDERVTIKYDNRADEIPFVEKVSGRH